MTIEFDIKAFERAVESGDDATILRLAPAALSFMQASVARDVCAPDVDAIVNSIGFAGDGIGGLLRVQAALKSYMGRRSGPVELRLNGIYQNHEASACVAIFDTERDAIEYFKSALLPEDQRYTDPGGYFRSFRSDSLCYNYNPHGPGRIEEGHGILFSMVPWKDYDDDSLFGDDPPERNPAPLTGPPPRPPEGSTIKSVEATT